MLDTNMFGEKLSNLGFRVYSGVPCSYLKDLINYAINEGDYIAAANEGDAVAIASGAYLGGQKPVVLMQNSGLANAVSPLVSLNYPFQIPVLGFVSLRGDPTGAPDEPQHELMGSITTRFLDLMQVKWMYLSEQMNEATDQLHEAERQISSNRPFFFVVRRGTFTPIPLREQRMCPHQNRVMIPQRTRDQLPTRKEALEVVNQLKDNRTVQLTTTGKTGRELYEIDDARNNLYMVGSLGCVGSLGLGLARSRSQLDIVVIDGDGSLFMRMGSLATNGYYAPPNMLHILLDNQSHDSTGGQATVSSNVNFVEIAAASGYAQSIYVHSLEELQQSILQWKTTRGLTFLYLRISNTCDEPLVRPKVKPHQVKERLLRFISDTENRTQGGDDA